ncbi:MAG: hypothetical protein IH621_13780 [Krumholzibacteria bacterium]|nr:hypothetical protein [Candidatus Krumholzibacteria bacterium]
MPIPTSNTMEKPICVADGLGGLIVVFELGNYNAGVGAQRYDALGRPLWGPEGVVVAHDAATARRTPVVAADGQGGAYVAWEDDILPTVDTIYAQHLQADGTASWTAGGIPLVTGNNFEVNNVAVAPTADGGAVVAWSIWFNPTFSVRVQKLTTAGPIWAYGGVTLVGGTDGIQVVRVAELVGGRTVVCWSSSPVGEEEAVWHSGLDGSGSVIWSPRSVFGTAGSERLEDVLADPRGGLWICAKIDLGNGGLVMNYLQENGTRLDGDGVPPSDAVSFQRDARLAPAPDGVWIAWYDTRGGDSLYAQRLSIGLTPLLDPAGVPVVDSPNDVEMGGLVADGRGGALVAWEDRRWSLDFDVLVQRIDAAGQTRWGDPGVCLRLSLDDSDSPTLASDGEGGLLAAWIEGSDGYPRVHAQRVERSGHWGYPAPAVAEIADVPADQGGEVLLSWDASRLDTWSDLGVAFYTVWRALPEEALAGREPVADWLDALAPADGAKAVAAPVVRAEASALADTYWLLLDTLDACQLPGYAAVVPTLADSTAADPADQVFQVLAHGVEAGVWWASEPAVGRSVDNVAPAAPAHLTGTANYQPVGMELRWARVAAPDLAAYVVHRGTTADFVPGRASEVAVVADTTCFDAGWGLDADAYYKVAAVDVHGNASAYALLAPSALSAVGDAPPAQTRLAANAPNPFNPATVIRYEVGTAGPVRLRVYDAAGRLVRTLLDAHHEPGPGASRWDGCDAAGRPVASGVYLYRLETADRVLTRPMTLLK